MAGELLVAEFTDPGCPFAFSAEPQRLKLSWTFGDQLEWTRRMVVLSESPDDYLDSGFTPEKQARSFQNLQARYGMPIDTALRPRMPATIVPCRAVVAARVNAGEEAEDLLLRSLRVRSFMGELFDEAPVIAAAAVDAGLDPEELEGWMHEPAIELTLLEDMRLARSPTPAALALNHKLADATVRPELSSSGRRYTCPSLLIATPDTENLIDVPGYQPYESYDVAVANLAPELERRAAAESVEEALAWADFPLATVEVAALRGIDVEQAREELAGVAEEQPVGRDAFWSQTPAPA